MNKIQFLIISSILLICVSGHAQNYELDYRIVMEPYEWSVKKIEKKEKSNQTVFIISVKNLSGIDQEFPFDQNHIADFEGRKYIVKPITYARYRGNSNDVIIKPGTSKDFIFTLPNFDFFDNRELTLIIGSKYYLNGIHFEDASPVSK